MKEDIKELLIENEELRKLYNIDVIFKKCIDVADKTNMNIKEALIFTLIKVFEVKKILYDNMIKITLESNLKLADPFSISKVFSFVALRKDLV